MAGDLLKRARALFGGEPAQPPAVVPRKPPNRFHAVTIVTGMRACAAAQALHDRRFLSRDAPPLPLKNCASHQCDCHYAHHDDRRKGGRRAHDLGVSIDGYEGDDLRQTPERRRRRTEGK